MTTTKRTTNLLSCRGHDRLASSNTLLPLRRLPPGTGPERNARHAQRAPLYPCVTDILVLLPLPLSFGVGTLGFRGFSHGSRTAAWFTSSVRCGAAAVEQR